MTDEATRQTATRIDPQELPVLNLIRGKHEHMMLAMSWPNVTRREEPQLDARHCRRLSSRPGGPVDELRDGSVAGGVLGGGVEYAQSPEEPAQLGIASQLQRAVGSGVANPPEEPREAILDGIAFQGRRDPFEQ